MILKPNHRAIISAAPHYDPTPLELERRDGFVELRRYGIIERKEGKTFLDSRHKLTTAGRAIKRLLEELDTVTERTNVPDCNPGGSYPHAGSNPAHVSKEFV